MRDTNWKLELWKCYWACYNWIRTLLKTGFVLIVTYGPMFHGLVYLEYGGDINITNVSGFYGPGAVLAWLLTAVLTAVSYRRAKLDPAGFTVTFVYASVAAIDFILHVSKGEYDAQYDAALAVCIYVTIFPALCLHGPVRYTFFTRWIWWQVRADNWSTVHPNYYSGWSLGYEVKVWVRMLLFTICGIPTLVNFFIPCFSMIGFAKAFPILVYGAFQVVSLKTDHLNDDHGYGWPCLINWVPISIECLAFSFGMRGSPLTCSSKNGELNIWFAFLRTASKLSDLDQAATLGAAILGEVYS